MGILSPEFPEFPLIETETAASHHLATICVVLAT